MATTLARRKPASDAGSAYPTPVLGFPSMTFSSKAEYGVRLMVELGREDGVGPISLKAIAEAEELPLSYLEHVVASLKRAGLVASSRGAHGGYRLPRPPPEGASGGAGA